MCGIGTRASRDFLFKRAASHRRVSAEPLVCLKRNGTRRKRGACVFRGLVFFYAPPLFAWGVVPFLYQRRGEGL